MGALGRGLINGSVFIAGSLAFGGIALAEAAGEDADVDAKVSVNFSASLGSRLQAERNNNLSRATTFPGQRDEDVQFFNEQGLHGHIYRVWVDAHLIFDRATGRYDYEQVND